MLRDQSFGRMTFRRVLSGFIVALEVWLSVIGAKNVYPATPGEALAQTPFSAVSCALLDASAETFVLPFNAVQRLFGGTDREHCLVFRFGNEPTYFEWIAQKIAWTGDAQYIRELKDKIVGFPQTDNGYLWSWSTSTYWPTGQGELHFDGLFRYVAAVAELIRWDGSAAFLEEIDETTFGDDAALDASKGRSVYDKCAAAMAYARNVLGGEEGHIMLTERAAYLSDGVSRLDRNADGVCVWNNTGCAGSASSNYWDNLCFGHLDAYETMLYYHALLAMRDIETMRGDPNAADMCAAHAARVKARFDELFWSEETGRYIACVDADGRRWDPGLTFLNTEALACGLGDAQKAKRIFSWLDGVRVVSGDTVRGRAIMDYGRMLSVVLGSKATKNHYRFAPITNTVSIESLSGEGAPWWFDLDGAIMVGEGGGAAFGHHLENGGYLFFPLYYELTARVRYLGAFSAAKRVRDLAKVYRFNGFDSDVGLWAEGMVGEFPESGIVTRVFLSAFCGVEPSADALVIRPRLPAGIRSLGADGLRYGAAVFHADVGRCTLSIRAQSTLGGVWRFYPDIPGEYTVEYTFADGSSEATVLRTAQDGSLELPLADRGVCAFHLTPCDF